MQIQIGPDKIEIRRDGRQVFEVLLGETVTLLAGAVEQRSGAPATIDRRDITPSALGASHYVVTSVDGALTDLRLFACEPACVPFIRGTHRPMGHGDPADPRHTLRAIVAERAPAFDGTAASLASVTLANYGAH